MGILLKIVYKFFRPKYIVSVFLFIFTFSIVNSQFIDSFTGSDVVILTTDSISRDVKETRVGTFADGKVGFLYKVSWNGYLAIFDPENYNPADPNSYPNYRNSNTYEDFSSYGGNTNVYPTDLSSSPIGTNKMLIAYSAGELDDSVVFTIFDSNGNQTTLSNTGGTRLGGNKHKVLTSYPASFIETVSLKQAPFKDHVLIAWRDNYPHLPDFQQRIKTVIVDEYGTVVWGLQNGDFQHLFTDMVNEGGENISFGPDNGIWLNESNSSFDRGRWFTYGDPRMPRSYEMETFTDTDGTEKILITITFDASGNSLVGLILDYTKINPAEDQSITVNSSSNKRVQEAFVIDGAGFVAGGVMDQSLIHIGNGKFLLAYAQRDGIGGVPNSGMYAIIDAKSNASVRCVVCDVNNTNTNFFTGANIDRSLYASKFGNEGNVMVFFSNSNNEAYQYKIFDNSTNTFGSEIYTIPNRFVNPNDSSVGFARQEGLDAVPVPGGKVALVFRFDIPGAYIPGYLALEENNEPVALPDSYRVEYETQLEIISPGVLGNDNDKDSYDTIESQLYQNPSNGILNFNSNGSFTYSPNTGFVGVDSFKYKVVDSRGLEGNTVDVLLRVSRPPVAADDYYSIFVNQTLEIVYDSSECLEAINQGLPESILCNDSHPDGDNIFVLEYDVNNEIIEGSYLDSEDSKGTFNFIPSKGFVGIQEFSYVIEDENRNTDEARITIEIKPYILEIDISEDYLFGTKLIQEELIIDLSEIYKFKKNRYGIEVLLSESYKFNRNVWDFLSSSSERYIFERSGVLENLSVNIEEIYKIDRNRYNLLTNIREDYLFVRESLLKELVIAIEENYLFGSGGIGSNIILAIEESYTFLSGGILSDLFVDIEENYVFGSGGIGSNIFLSIEESYKFLSGGILSDLFVNLEENYLFDRSGLFASLNIEASEDYVFVMTSDNCIDPVYLIQEPTRDSSMRLGEMDAVDLNRYIAAYQNLNVLGANEEMVDYTKPLLIDCSGDVIPHWSEALDKVFSELPTEGYEDYTSLQGGECIDPREVLQAGLTPDLGEMDAENLNKFIAAYQSLNRINARMIEEVRLDLYLCPVSVNDWNTDLDGVFAK